MQWPAEYAFDPAIQHGMPDLIFTPLPIARIFPPVPFDEVAGNQRMLVKAFGQQRHAHAVIDAEL